MNRERKEKKRERKKMNVLGFEFSVIFGFIGGGN
jgi:hypothetical protein